MFYSPYPHVYSLEDVDRLHVTGGHRMLKGCVFMQRHSTLILGVYNGDTVACLYTG
jgi:hypothetical protein